MSPSWVLAVAVMLVPALAHGDEGDFLPSRFPKQVGPFWWEESPASTRSKCSKSTLHSNESLSLVDCTGKDGMKYFLVFNRSKKLCHVQHEISDWFYTQCQQEIVASLGPKARFEWPSGPLQNMGTGEAASDFERIEAWAVDYLFKGKTRGSVTCAQPFGGSDPSHRGDPYVIFQTPGCPGGVAANRIVIIPPNLRKPSTARK